MPVAYPAARRWSASVTLPQRQPVKPLALQRVDGRSPCDAGTDPSSAPPAPAHTRRNRSSAASGTRSRPRARPTPAVRARTVIETAQSPHNPYRQPRSTRCWAAVMFQFLSRYSGGSSSWKARKRACVALHGHGPDLCSGSYHRTQKMRAESKLPGTSSSQPCRDTPVGAFGVIPPARLRVETVTSPSMAIRSSHRL